MSDSGEKTTSNTIDRDGSYPHTDPVDPGREASRWVQRNDTRTQKVIDLLEANLGVPQHPGRRNGLQVLVLTILSQNTTDPNALKAYEQLLKDFPADSENETESNDLPRNEDGEVDSVKLRMSQVADTFPSPDWEAVRNSKPEQLQDSIKVCGLQKSKAATIQRSLDWIKERTGGFKLEPVIQGKKPYDAARTLSDVKGIGIKTAAVTLMEADQVDLCPVDTHVHRICQRLRLVEETSSRKKTFRDLQPLIPSGKGHSFHHNLLTFGRTVCTARDPDCDSCFLSQICYYNRCEQNGETLTLKFTD